MCRSGRSACLPESFQRSASAQAPAPQPVLAAEQRGDGVILPDRAGLGWVPAVWKEHIQPKVPTWATNFAFFLVFYTLFPWLMGPMKGEDHVEVEACPCSPACLPSFPPPVCEL